MIQALIAIRRNDDENIKNGLTIIRTSVAPINDQNISRNHGSINPISRTEIWWLFQGIPCSA